MKHDRRYLLLYPHGEYKGVGWEESAQSINFIKESPLFRGKGHFFWVLKPGFNLQSGGGGTLRQSKGWLTTKRVHILECTLIYASKGWRSGESARLPPMWPGFESSRRRHIWVEFVVGSLPCSERFFSGYSGFPLSLKTNTSKFQFDLERTDTFQRVHMNSLVLRG